MLGNTVSLASISDEVREELKALRSRKSKDSMAIVLKIDSDTLSVVSDETYEDITLDELGEEGRQNISSFKDILHGNHDGHTY